MQARQESLAATPVLSGLQTTLFFETPGRDLCPRVPRTEAAHQPARDSRGILPVRQRRQFHPHDGCRRCTCASRMSLRALPLRSWKRWRTSCLGKLFRRPIARAYAHRYRLYLNRRDVRQRMHVIRQIRGRKFVSGPAGAHHHLEQIFEDLNARFFDGLMGRPLLGWSRRRFTLHAGAFRSVPQRHHHQPDFRYTNRFRCWLWNMFYFTRCCICGIRWITVAHAEGCTRGNFATRRSDFPSFARPKRC